MSTVALERPKQAVAADPLQQLAVAEDVVTEIHREVTAALRGARHGVSAVQGLILARLGEREMTVGEMCDAGIYAGENISFNLKKLATLGLVENRVSPHDSRCRYICCTKAAAQGAALVIETVSRSQHLSRIRIFP